MEFGYNDIQEAGGAGEVVLKAFLNLYIHEEVPQNGNRKICDQVPVIIPGRLNTLRKKCCCCFDEKNILKNFFLILGNIKKLFSSLHRKTNFKTVTCLNE